MHPYNQARDLIGLVYVHPISNALVVFTDYDRMLDPCLTWRLVTGEGSGRVLTSTVMKGDGRWVQHEGSSISILLPYSHRS